MAHRLDTSPDEGTQVRDRSHAGQRSWARRRKTQGEPQVVGGTDRRPEGQAQDDRSPQRGLGNTLCRFCRDHAPQGQTARRGRLQPLRRVAFDRFYGILFHQARNRRWARFSTAPRRAATRPCIGPAPTSPWPPGRRPVDYPQSARKAWETRHASAGKAVFNSELHLYHEGYAFFGSPAKSHYRYFLSALNGEWMSASFAWGQWNNPGTQAIHRAMPKILADLKRLEPQLAGLQHGDSRGARRVVHALGRRRRCRSGYRPKSPIWERAGSSCLRKILHALRARLPSEEHPPVAGRLPGPRQPAGRRAHCIRRKQRAGRRVWPSPAGQARGEHHASRVSEYAPSI